MNNNRILLRGDLVTLDWRGSGGKYMVSAENWQLGILAVEIITNTQDPVLGL